MPVRDTLPAILRGEEAADLGPDSRTRLEALAEEAHASQQLTHVRDECAARLKQAGAPLSVEYLLAAACELNGEHERAHQTLLVLGEKLVGARNWKTLAAVAERALAIEETHAAARLLVKAHEGIGRDPARVDALWRAWGLIPDDLELGLLLTVRLGEAGRGEQRRALLAELLPRFAAEARYAGLEEAALEFVEHEDLDGLLAVIGTLPAVAEQGALTECAQLLDIALPAVKRGERAGEALAPLRVLVKHATDALGAAGAETFREGVLAALHQGPGRELPRPEPVFKLSAVEDRMKPLLPALERFDAIASLPPGRAVLHDSFGAGRVASNDGETVFIDFARSSGHKMPYTAARRTLSPLAEDDLRLLAATHPQELQRLKADEPSEIVRRALLALGGAADAQKLKVFLVGSNLVPVAEWTAFWRRSRAAIKKEPRIDASRDFEQHYRITPDSGVAAADNAPLPAFEPRKSLKANLATLRKFLNQHPGAESALSKRFARYIERGLFDEEAERADRARAGIYFSRWFPERTPEWASVLMGLWEQGLAVSDLSGEEEQLTLLEASHAAGVESDAILSALDSRFSAVRDAAAVLRERLDDRGRADLRKTMLQHAPRYPGAALRLIEETLASDASTEERWRVLIAALTLIEEKPKPSVADKVLRWLEPGGAFDRMLSDRKCPETLRLQMRVLLRQWRSSDRFLFPAIEAIERLGLGEEAQMVHSARQKSAQKLFDRVGQQAEEVDLPVMTRATWERLKSELDRMERELRTTIPATIQKARELGDLRENAEYHSAKLKQANVSRLVRSLQQRLARARFVDDIEHKDGIVGLGAEVVLEGDSEVVTYWVLGEEEHHHGEHVVSFQAPVGRALMGRSIGDEIELGDTEQRRRFRIVSIERKLPPAESTAAPSSTE
jgi:transcription elongation factor GreA